MIETKDMQEIDERYFIILARNPYCILLRSRGTGHYWHLLEQNAAGHRTFRIRHKHNSKDPYHVQKNRPSVAECCRYIIDHDAYHMERVRKQKERRLRRLGLIAGEDPQDRPRKRKKKRGE